MKSKPIYKILLLIIFSLVTLLLTAGEEGRFYFAFVSVDPWENVTPIVEKEINLEEIKGELQIYFRPMKKAYLYLLLYGPGKNLNILFSPSSTIFKKRYDTFRQEVPVIRFPEIPGEYELHVLAAVERLKELEKMLDLYRGLEESEKTIYKRQDLMKELFFLVQKIKREYHLTIICQEKFNEEAVVNRIEEDKLLQFTEKIVFLGLYSKIYYFKKK